MSLQILGYLVGVIVVHMVFGNKATLYFVGLVFFTVLILNADKLKNVFNTGGKKI